MSVSQEWDSEAKVGSQIPGKRGRQLRVGLRCSQSGAEKQSARCRGSEVRIETLKWSVRVGLRSRELKSWDDDQMSQHFW